VSIDATLSNYKNDDVTHRADIHLLFHRPTNYTKVFWHVLIDDFIHLHQIPKDRWVLKSDHDSCWTSDDLETPLNEVWCKLREMFPKETPYVDLSPFASFGITSPKLVRVDIERVRGAEPFRKYTVKVHEYLDRHDLISSLLKQDGILPLLINLPGWDELAKAKLRDPY
jgi:hypothetical protein